MSGASCSSTHVALGLAQHFAGFAQDIVVGHVCATAKLGIGHGVFLDAAFNSFKAIS